MVLKLVSVITNKRIPEYIVGKDKKEFAAGLKTIYHATFEEIG